jgi:hypothetical protein
MIFSVTSASPLTEFSEFFMITHYLAVLGSWYGNLGVLLFGDVELLLYFAVGAFIGWLYGYFANTSETKEAPARFDANNW